MNERKLPEELLRIVLLLSANSDILSWCSTSSLINSICVDKTFWEEKLTRDYPNYQGRLYKNSPRETIKLLSIGKKIRRYHEDKFAEIHKLSPEKIDGKTTLTNISRGKRYWQIPFHIDDNEYIIFRSRTTIIVPPIIPNIDVSQPLYTILLPNGENLLITITKIFV